MNEEQSDGLMAMDLKRNIIKSITLLFYSLVSLQLDATSLTSLQNEGQHWASVTPCFAVASAVCLSGNWLGGQNMSSKSRSLRAASHLARLIIKFIMRAWSRTSPCFLRERKEKHVFFCDKEWTSEAEDYWRIKVILSSSNSQPRGRLIVPLVS